MQGLSLHFGLNKLDPQSYGGWAGQLQAAERDAFAMRDVCRQNGLIPDLVTTSDCLADTMLWKLSQAAELLQAGELLVFTYSGFGGQMLDPWSQSGSSSTIAAYDREIVLHELWGGFREGVRILAILDCHSGHVADENWMRVHNGRAVRHKAIPHDVAAIHRSEPGRKKLFGRIVRNYVQPRAGVIQLAACQDNQTAADGDWNSLFTAKAIEVWNQGKFRGDHGLFHKRVVARMPADQTPNYSETGVVTREQRAARPFSV